MAMECLLTYAPPPYLPPSLLLHCNAKCLLITRPNPSLFCLSASPTPNPNPCPNPEGTYSKDPRKMLESLRSWSVPFALGASVGSLIPRKLVVFLAPISLLLVFLVRKGLEPKGGLFIAVEDLESTRLKASDGLNHVKAAFHRAVEGLLCVIVSLKSMIEGFFGQKLSDNYVVGRITGPFQRFLNSFWEIIQSVASQRKMEVKSRVMPENSAFIYINDCISEVEKSIQVKESSEEILNPNRLQELRETLRLLKRAIAQKESAVLSTEATGMAEEEPISEINKKNKMTVKKKKKKQQEEGPEIGIALSAAESSQDSTEVEMHNVSQSVGVDLGAIKSRQHHGSHKQDNVWSEIKHDVTVSKVGESSIDQSNRKTISASNVYPDYWLQDDSGDDRVSTSTSTFETEQTEMKFNEGGGEFVPKPERDSVVESKQLEVRKEVEVKERDSKRSQSNSKESMVENNDFESNKKDKATEEFSNDPLDLMKELAFVPADPYIPLISGLSTIRQSAEFQELMTGGESLFKSGRIGLTGKIDVGEAETILYGAAERFGSACSLDPSSIEAIGSWGNTLFVHGKLKLKLIKEMQFIISTAPMISSYQRRKQKPQIQEAKKWVALEETLQKISKECEELLVQSGRKYRAVLSISNRDIPALYNWGLALCLRAQLVASGQNAAESADKLYLAAIDKFEALMGISHRHAPDAMLNWGLALKARSRLYPMTSPERANLLNQAKQLFEDALVLQPRDARICGAYAASNVELEELQRKEMESKRNTRSDR